MKNECLAARGSTASEQRVGSEEPEPSSSKPSPPPPDTTMKKEKEPSEPPKEEEEDVKPPPSPALIPASAAPAIAPSPLKVFIRSHIVSLASIGTILVCSP